ncbi:MAG: hypothetical protein OEV94_08230 [Deltaproteobacteria bacterium]|nr:hypothetical protein [Deltaproteobacteria bacterium]
MNPLSLFVSLRLVSLRRLPMTLVVAVLMSGAVPQLALAEGEVQAAVSPIPAALPAPAWAAPQDQGLVWLKASIITPKSKNPRDGTQTHQATQVVLTDGNQEFLLENRQGVLAGTLPPGTYHLIEIRRKEEFNGNITVFRYFPPVENWMTVRSSAGGTVFVGILEIRAKGFLTWNDKIPFLRTATAKEEQSSRTQLAATLPDNHPWAAALAKPGRVEAPPAHVPGKRRRHR